MGVRYFEVSSEGTIRYHYDDAGQLLQETTGTGALIRAYLWADGAPVAQITKTPSGEVLAYLHTDHLNTPRLATNSTGNVVWRWEGNAFGDNVPNEDPGNTGVMTTVNLRFAGQYYDRESGLHYNWHRYYDPRIGRYITSDPIGLRGGLNTYRYAEANPIRYTDPRGLSSFDEFGNWLDKEQYMQDTINSQGDQFLQNWADFMGAWGETSAALLGVRMCSSMSAHQVKKACVVVGLCTSTGRGEILDDVARELIARDSRRRAAEIVQQVTKPLIK